jgi:hypothetical protein
MQGKTVLWLTKSPMKFRWGRPYVTCLIIVDIRQQPMTGINTSDIAVMLSHREELFHLYMTSVPIDVGFARSWRKIIHKKFRNLYLLHVLGTIQLWAQGEWTRKISIRVSFYHVAWKYFRKAIQSFSAANHYFSPPIDQVFSLPYSLKWLTKELFRK